MSTHISWGQVSEYFSHLSSWSTVPCSRCYESLKEFLYIGETRRGAYPRRGWRRHKPFLQPATTITQHDQILSQRRKGISNTTQIRCAHCHGQITVNFTLYLLSFWWDSLQLLILAGNSISHLSSLLQLRDATPFWEHELFPTRVDIYPPLLTDPEGDSCFSIYQIRWIKKKRFFNFFF